MTTDPKNPTGLMGIQFVEFASPEPKAIHELLLDFGFSRVARHLERDVDLYEQNGIWMLLNRDRASFGGRFAREHGPSICSMGWRVRDPASALAAAIERGAKRADGDYAFGGGPCPAIEGVGGSLLYFVDEGPLGFVPLEKPERVMQKGFVAIDHLTNNVEKGTMERWRRFYEEVFAFTPVRTFEIRGDKTGLSSFALRSPCGTFCIPINEADEAKSQINEFIEQYRGSGVQHLAFATDNILDSLAKLEGSRVSFLDIDDGYYRSVWNRVPGVTEDHAEIARRNVLVDGDDDGYLLQIFTRPLCGPIFIELIQRRNHHSFGEGNFGALFRSIERDQARRGIFD